MCAQFVFSSRSLQAAASQKVARQDLKVAAFNAKRMVKYGRYLHRAVEQRDGSRKHLTVEQKKIHDDFVRGLLQAEANRAVAAFGHGKIVSQSGEVRHIGGSTGGQLRRLLDGYEEPKIGEMDDLW